MKSNKHRLNTFTLHLLRTSMVLAIGWGAAPFTARAHSDAPTAETEHILHQLAEGNRRYIAKNDTSSLKLNLKNSVRSKGEYPQVVVVAPVESKISPETIFDQGMGKLFVVRTSSEGLDSKAAERIKFATQQLGSPVILVLGIESRGSSETRSEGSAHFTQKVSESIQSLPPIRQLRAEGKVQVIASRVDTTRGAVHFGKEVTRLRISQN